MPDPLRMRMPLDDDEHQAPVMTVAGFVSTLALASTVIILSVRAVRRRRSRRHNRRCLEYVEWARARDMHRFPTLYPTEEEWNRRELEDEVRRFNVAPKTLYEQVKQSMDTNSTIEYVRRNDPAVLRSRIADLEEELGL